MRSSADEINNVPWERLAVRLIGCQKERERETDWMETPLLLLRRRHFSPLAFSFPYVRRAARTRTLFSKIVLLMKPDRRRDFVYVKLGLGKKKYWKKLSYSRTFDTRSPRIRSVYFSFLTSIACRNLEIYAIVLWYYWMPMRNPAPTTNCYFILRNEEINLPRSRCCSKFSGILIIVT